MSAIAEKLKYCQAQHYRNLAIVVETSYGATDFAMALRHIVRFTDITPAQIADGAQASEATVNRWMSAKVIPAPLIRNIAIKWITDELERRAETITRAYERYLSSPDSPA